MYVTYTIYSIYGMREPPGGNLPVVTSEVDSAFSKVEATMPAHGLDTWRKL